MPSLGSSATLVGLVAVGGLGLLVALAAASSILLQKGRRRAALVAPLLPLASLPVLAAVGLGSFRLVEVFGAMAASGSGSAEVVALGREIWLVTRVAGGVLLLLGALGLIGGLLRIGAEDPAPPCSPARAAVLLLLPAAALALLVGLVREQHVALHVSRIVVEDRSPENEAAFAAYGFGEGSGAIAAVSHRIARATTLGGAGSILAAVVLLGLSVSGGLLAWPVQVGPVFTAASVVAWAGVQALGLVLAAGLYTPF